MPSVQIPIIDQLVHPSFGLLTRVAVPGNPLAGPFIALAPPQNPLVALTYGVVLKVHTVGAFHGHDISSPDEFEPALGKIAVHYTDLSGLDIIQQVERWTYTNQVYFWNEALPTLWTLYMAPDVTADLFWMQT
jgi:hypothetical protein